METKGVKTIALLSALFLAFLGSSWSPQAWAERDFVEVTTEAVSDKPSLAAAKQEIFQLATDAISEKYIRQIIGDSKFEKNKDLIKNKILSNSSKYVLSLKGDQAEKTASGHRMAVTIKLALKSLRQLLLNQGLFYEIEGPPKVLTLLAFENRVDGSSFSWWADEVDRENSQLRVLNQEYQAALRAQMTPKGFYTLKMGSDASQNALPLTLKNADSPTEDLLLIGDFFRAQIVVLGRVQLKKSAKRPDVFEMHIRSAATYTSNGRVVGEVLRVFETQPGILNQVVLAKAKEVFAGAAADLTEQVYEAWKSGTFGSSLLRLEVSGSMGFKEVSLLKDQLLTGVSELKSLKERKFTASEVVFEVDSGVSAQKLAESLKATQFKDFRLSVVDWSNEQVKLAIQFN